MTCEYILGGYDAKNEYYDIYINKLNYPIPTMVDTVYGADGLLAREEIE